MRSKSFILIMALAFLFLPALVLAEITTATATAPDLKITAENLTFTPASLTAGASATFKAKVENAGNVSASNIKVRFYLGDTQVGEKIISSLSKNYYYYTSVTYAIPATVFGNSVLKAIVDPLDAIIESDESNNTASKDVMITRLLPDIKITAANLTISPLPIKGGDTATFKAKVENSGSANATNVKVTFFLGDQQVGEKTIATLYKNSYSYQSVTYAMPSSASGNQTLKVKVDGINAILEGDETNNEAVKDFPVSLNIPDVQVVPNSLSISPIAYKGGDAVTIKATIKNIGIGAAKNFKVKFYLADTMILEKLYASLNSNSAQTASFSYKLPITLFGEQTLKVIIDQANTLAEGDETNNSEEKTISINPAFIDLALSADQLTFSPPSPKPGQTVTIKGLVNNSGNSAATKVKTSIYVNDVKVKDYTNMTVGVNGKYNVSATYRIPTSALEELKIKIVADPDNAIAEKDETNNQAEKGLVLNPLNIDLALKAADWKFIPENSAVVAGRKFKVSGRISNIGRDNAEATKLSISLIKYEDVIVEKDEAVYNIIERLKNNMIKLSDLLKQREKDLDKEQIANLTEKKRILVSLGTIAIPALGPNKTTSITKEVTLPADYSYTSAEIELNANYDAKVYEVDRGNNILLMDLKTSPKSFDAAIANDAITHSPANRLIKAGENVYVISRAINLGTEKIAALQVKYYLNTKAELDGATLVATKSVSNLAEGKSVNFTQQITIPAAAQQNQVVIVSIDPGNVIKESNESNNIAYHTIPVNPQTRDLSVEVLRSNPVNPKVGETVNFTVQVKNFGNTKADNVVLAIYTNIYADQPTQTVTIPTIGTSQSVERRFSWIVPANLAYAVNYPIRAIADSSNSINETNESNNIKNYLLSLKAPDLSVVANEVTFFPQVGIYKGENFRVHARVINNNVLPVSNAKVGLFYYVVGANNNITKLAEIDLGSFAKNQSREFDLYAKLPDTVALGSNVGIIVGADSANQTLESDEANNSATINKTVVEPPRRLQGNLLNIEVEDDQWEDLNGATITLKNDATGATQSKVTGSENFYYSVGRVVFENMPSANTPYTLTIAAPNYRTITDTFTYNLEDWETYDRWYTLDKKAVISGRITANGAGLSGVTVNIVDTGVGAQTDANGNYRFILEPGNYKIKYTKEGYNRLIENINLVSLQTLVMDRIMTGASVGYFEGTITNDDGNPLAGAEVKKGDTTVAYTDYQGKFSVNVIGNATFKFRAANYTGIDMPAENYLAGKEYVVNLQLFKPSTANHVERGATFVSWHQSVGTPANAFFIPEYNVDVWWGIGKVKMGLDFTQNDSSTKLQTLTVKMTADKWECHQVSGAGDIETSAINIPITISAGGCDNWDTKITVAKIAIVSNGEEVWSNEDYWTTTQDPTFSVTKTYALNNLAVNWNSDFKIKIWYRVEKKSGVTSEGEGAGALSGYNLDKKLVTWKPAKPPTTQVSTSWGQVGSYLVGLLDTNPLQVAYNAVANFTDLFTVQEFDQWSMEEVLPSDYPGAPQY